MIKVRVATKTSYTIELPVESFEEITTDRMPIHKSDEMIVDILAEKYGVEVDQVVSVNPIN